MIAPELFDIYSEDLLYKLGLGGINREDFLAYADDILIFCAPKEMRKN
jgi:hypothetical protein